VRTAGIRLLLDLSILSLGESNHEDSEEVAVGRLDIDEALNERLPFSNHRIKLIGSDIQAVEGSLGSMTFNLIKDQLYFSPLQSLLIVN